MSFISPNRRAVMTGLAGGLLSVGPLRVFAQEGTDAVRFQYSVGRRAFGVLISAMPDGSTLIAVRSLDGAFNRAFLLPRDQAVEASAFEMTHGGRRYTLQEASDWVAFNGPEVSIRPPEGPGAQSRGFLRRLKERIKGVLQGIGISIAVGITLVLGGDTVFPLGGGKYVYASNTGGDILVTITSDGGSFMLPRPEGRQQY